LLLTQTAIKLFALRRCLFGLGNELTDADRCALHP